MFGAIKKLFATTPKKPKPQKPKSKSREVAESIAQEFLSGEITVRDIQANGISELGVVWRGKRVRISWYSVNIPRTLEIDGMASLPMSDHMIILRAAQTRANHISNEDLENLHKLL